MSADRELLALAAKAATVFMTRKDLAEKLPKWEWDDGDEPYFDDGDGICGTVIWYGSKGEVGGTELSRWSPLADDGDAFRLAVKLGLLVDTNGMYARVCFPYEAPLACEAMGDDRNAATRRAIVRAAAEIGKEMP